ncbi:hypothetical protein V1L54_01090 [Streptomyces sp. TRM 70361]|uniref:DUF7919 family protein n=1 Tax=Streptomyces sp. TRM 70361 TaxID=3116553 RepID=UPI002E7AF503|nr:hypothetical protein [Streptomyces sp. TRM 70361]MEE1938026.1 hypothetical protein [Streptomyces sp. TRM 70361]
MAYYPDLAPYSYDESDREMLNAGWLAPEHDYCKGIVDERVVHASRVLNAAYDNQTRGVHHCEFCDADRPFVLGGTTGDTKVRLGSTEIRVRGNNTIYAAPDLTTHYITEHQYRPPEEFCRAAAKAAGIETAGQLTLSEQSSEEDTGF